MSKHVPEILEVLAYSLYKTLYQSHEHSDPKVGWRSDYGTRDMFRADAAKILDSLYECGVTLTGKIATKNFITSLITQPAMIAYSLDETDTTPPKTLTDS